MKYEKLDYKQYVHEDNLPEFITSELYMGKYNYVIGDMIHQGKLDAFVLERVRQDPRKFLSHAFM